MKTVTKEQIIAIKPGATMQFALMDSSCVGRAKQAVQYVKMNLLMPKDVETYHTSFDRNTNIFSVEAVARQ